MSANTRTLRYGQQKGDRTRARTAIRKEQFNERDFRQEITESCKEMGGKPILRIKPIELDYNEALTVLSAKACRRAPPKKKFRIYPTLLPRKELERLKDASRVVSLEEKMAELERQKQEQQRIFNESEQRKKLLQEIDDAKMKAKHEREMEKPKDTDELDENNRHKVLERAFLAKHEREEEVKKANRIILEAKCHIIREAQVAERNELAKELKEEERRLEKMMLDERDKAFQEDDKRLQKVEVEKKKYAEEIKRQLEEREFIRQKEAERIEEEAKIRGLAAAAIQRDEQIRAEIERQKRDKLRGDLQKIAEMSKFFKKMEFEQERQSEMQVLEFMKAKEERANKIALEKKLAKEAIERKQEKLLIQQAKAMTTKSVKDEMLIRREQEKKEREYRQKEKEAALKKKKLDQELAEARRIQLEDMKRRQAMQIARDESDFRKIVDSLKSEEAKDKELEERRLRNKDKYREEIIRQMNMKEMERRELQRRAQNEHLAWQEKEKNRDKNIRSIIKAKLEQMREANLPEKYIKDVEKQLKITV